MPWLWLQAALAACAAFMAHTLMRCVRTDFAWKWFSYEDPRTGERDYNYDRIAAAIVFIPSLAVAAIVFSIDLNIKHAGAGFTLTLVVIGLVAACWRPAVEIITGKPINP
jgi:hypothetical protein